MVGQRTELLDFVQLRRRDDRQRIFLALDDLGLQRGVNFAEIDRGGRCIERLEHRGPERRHRHADLEALEVFRAVDRLGRRRGLAEAVVPDLVHDNEIGLGDLATDMGAQAAVHGLPDRVVVRERKADAADRRCRHQRRQNQPRQREEFDAAGPDLAQHVRVGTELVVRKDLQVEPAIGLGLDRRRHFLGACVHGMAVRKVIGVLVGKFGGLGPRHQRRADAAQNR